MGEIAVVFNPTSGQGRAAGQQKYIARKLKSLGNLHWYNTQRAGHAAELAAAAARRGAEIVVAAGGDGTVNEVVNGMLSVNGQCRSKTALAVLPLGCANDFAKGLQIRNTADACRQLACNRRRTVDIGRVTTSGNGHHYFTFSSGIGFVASVAWARNGIPLLRGSALYLLAAANCLKSHRRGQMMRITFDSDHVVKGPLLMLSINNCPTVGGFPLTPDAQMDDGWLDVLVVDQTNLARMVYLLLAARWGKHLNHTEFTLRRAQHLLVEAAQPFPLHLDGQIYRPYWYRTRRLEVSAVGQALAVVA